MTNLTEVQELQSNLDSATLRWRIEITKQPTNFQRLLVLENDVHNAYNALENYRIKAYLQRVGQ